MFTSTGSLFSPVRWCFDMSSSKFQSYKLRRVRPIVLVVFLLITQLTTTAVNAQGCSVIGQVCGRTSDCCRGCCESYQCVDRSYCTNDLGLAGMGGIGSGAGSCQGFYCPPGQMCYPAQICPPGTVCSSQPMCRPYGGYGGGYFWRNSAQKSSSPVYALALIAIGILAMTSA